MKVIIIGAGQGGMQAARTLANGGANVTVYEKSKRAELCYDWHDDVSADVLNELNIPLPEGEYFRGDSASLVAPFSNMPLKVEADENKRDWAIERRALSATLVRLAEEAGAKFVFNTTIDSLAIENGRVCGVFTDNKKISAELVIDSSGALSKIRASLPESFCIQANPKPCEVFRVYRAFLAPADGVEWPTEHPKKVYLKHLGEDGISWCMAEPNGSINILVGRTGELPQSTLDNALTELRHDNPIIGSELLRGGIICTIPIRYPLSRMVAPGYAAVGDAAFMTIPMIGSGIANSLRAGEILAQTVLSSNSSDIESLWKYQVKYYTQIGAEHVCVDLIKRALLGMDGTDIRFLFDKGVINEEDMQSIQSGEAMVMTPSKILDKIIKCRHKLGLLLGLKSAISAGEKAQEFAKTIPHDFDEKSVIEWQKKLDSFFS